MSDESTHATPDAGDASEPLSEAGYYVMEVDGATGELTTRPPRPDDAFCPHCHGGIKDYVASREAAAATRARAEALREAAAEWEQEDTDAVGDWLRARADSLTPDTPARTIPTTATVRDGIKARTAADDKVALNRALNRDVP